MAAPNDHEKSKEISKSPTKDEEEEKEINLWSKLPLELVGKISEHAYASDPGAIATMLATCKSWNMINTINIRYPLSPPSNLMEDHLYPYLLTLVDSTCKFVHPIYDYNFSLETPELSGAFIRSSKFGWLLLTGSINGSHFFFNPFTRQKIDLPDVTYGDHLNDHLENGPPQCFLTMYFSAPPTCVDCYVIGMDLFVVVILRPSSEHWESYKFDMEKNWKRHWINPEHFKNYGLLHWVSNCHPIIHEEKCYFLGWDGCLIVFDFKTNEFSSIGGSLFDFTTNKYSSIEGSFLNKEEVDSLYRSFLMKNGDELIGVQERRKYSHWKAKTLYEKETLATACKFG